MCVATASYQHENEPKAITTEEQNSTFLKHATCIYEDGQLGRNMSWELQQRGEEEG
jgi:hypothetical protein